MVTRRCDRCGTEFEAKTVRARFCTAACRNRNHRGASISALRPAAEPLGVYAATLAGLESAGRASSPEGQIALRLALRLDAATADTGSSVAAVARELRQALDAALAGAAKAGDPFDELAARRALRVAGA